MRACADKFTESYVLADKLHQRNTTGSRYWIWQKKEGTTSGNSDCHLKNIEMENASGKASQIKKDNYIGILQTLYIFC